MEALVGNQILQELLVELGYDLDVDHGDCDCNWHGTAHYDYHCGHEHHNDDYCH